MSQRHPSASWSCPSLWCLELDPVWEFPFRPKMQEKNLWNLSWMLVIYVGDYIYQNSNHIICFVFLSPPFGARLQAVMSRVLPGSAIPLLTNRPLISTSTMYVLPSVPTHHVCTTQYPVTSTHPPCMYYPPTASNFINTVAAFQKILPLK